MARAKRATKADLRVTKNGQVSWPIRVTLDERIRKETIRRSSREEKPVSTLIGEFITAEITKGSS